ncbi:MAG: MBOAT family O-acyltransferase, partial [Synechococcales bacterium]|nr:MBOAT family O-acyltransferase [Synechococcales bacterium]
AFNLGILGYYKYTEFFLSSFNNLLGLNLPIPEILLPLGVSFYSFTQIAYLVDVYRTEPGECQYTFIHYLLFVIFFPQLIAGPILRHNELIPEFENRKNFMFSHENVALGLATFVLGLGKKVMIADNIAPWVAPVFEHASDVTFLEAWVGALSYTIQLYFDFSGYSDMAIGLGLLFNFHMPVNFNSPYKALSIVDFWRRWHITLSHFLRDYLYIPLGGSRKGEARRYVNLTTTMLLGGLWHGAGWTYVVWGGLHGLYLSINHGWRKLGIPLPPVVSWLLTFTAVVVSWVLFRAATFGDAIAILQAMVGASGIVLPTEFQASYPWLGQLGLQFGQLDYMPTYVGQSFLILASLIGIVVFFPNTQELVKRFEPNLRWVFAIGFVAAVCLVSMNQVSEFLYFQF